MELLEGIAKLVNQFRLIGWEWNKASMERIASELGLVDPTTGSDRWIGYRSAAPDFLWEHMEHPYGFAFRGQEVFHFQVTIDEFDMGEVYLYEPDSYNKVYEELHTRFRSSFRKSVKTITKLLGNPLFNGGQNDPNIIEAHPIGWGADLVAVWPLTNSRLILAYGQEDKELPITLDLFVCPPREED